MPEIVLVLLFVVAVLFFALYGFIAFLIRLFDNKEERVQEPERTSPRPTLNLDLRDDVHGAARLLNHLFRTEKLDPKTYRKTREFLETEFAEFTLDPKIETRSDSETEEFPAVETIANDTVEVDGNEIVDGNLVEIVSDPRASNLTGQRSERVAPWDLPDPDPEPRRTLKEMLASFMLDKNIRIGELASGILIVGSAVGLVISLRNELQDAIPYFSALLFLLITAAIHAAGIYTLKKWKLRNTSRGTLLIGFLLIPLNFLAACILSNEEAQPRELTDPLLWTAIIVGLVSFGTMTWFSGKCLLRKGQLPLTLAVMGGAIGTLVINRTEGIDESTFVKLALSLILVVSFLAGTTFIFRQQWFRKRWPRRAAYRMLIFLGISGFAFINGAAMLVIRAEYNPPTWVALAPSFAIVALVGAWFGNIIWKGAQANRHEDSKPLEIAGLAMLIFGLMVVAVAWLGSFANPMVLLVTSALMTLGLVMVAIHQHQPKLLIAGWVAFGSFVLCCVNLLAGQLPWDAWTSLPQLSQAVLSGRSGISLLLVGAGIIGVHKFFDRKTSVPDSFRVVGFASGGVVFAVGLVLAIAASFVNRDNVFDNMTATSLLGLATGLSLVGCVLQLRPMRETGDSDWSNALNERSNWLVAGVAAILLAFLAHAFGWNPVLADWLNQLAFSIQANWPLIFTMHAVVFGVVAAIGYSLTRSQPGLLVDDTSRRRLDSYTEWVVGIAWFTGVIALVGAVLLIPHQTGVATIIVLLISVASLLSAWSMQRHEMKKFWSTTFTMLTAVCVSVFVMELLTRKDWCPAIDHPRHWLIQIAALAIWYLVWLIGAWVIGSGKRFRFLDMERELTIAIGTALATAFVVMTGLSLAFESNVELFQNASVPPYSIAAENTWAFGALFVLALALLVAVFKEPSNSLGAAMIVVWSTAWAMGSFYFADAKAVATGMRWLMPIGGAFAAIGIASRKPAVLAWVAARNKAGLKGRSVWPGSTTQQLINLSLGIVVLVVMSLSTIAIVSFMMFGGAEALGGPIKGTLFGDMKKDVSYGLPIGIIVNTFLLYAISERRKWLATAGSLVFQYCVILSVILLFVSPHPKLASSWFVNILQAVSVGMTGYGFVWWYFHERVEGFARTAATAADSGGRKSQLEIHTLINGLLVTSLAVLVMTRFFRFPTESGDWINSVGGPLGVGAWAMFAVLVYLVWKYQLRQSHRTSSWMWLSCWSGLVLVGMVAALFDRNLSAQENYQAWNTFNLILWGAVLVCLIQIGMLFFERRPVLSAVASDEGAAGTGAEIANHLSMSATGAKGNSSQTTGWSIRSDQTIPLLFASLVALLFAVRGMLDPSNFWISFAASVCLVVLLTLGGFLRESRLLGFVSAGFASVGSLMLVAQDPNAWFVASQPYAVNVLAVVLSILAMVWCVYYIVQTVFRKQPADPRMMWMPNLITGLVALWLLLGSLVQFIMETDSVTGVSCLKNGWGFLLFFTAGALCYVQLWNRSRKGLVAAGCMWWFGLTFFVVAVGVRGSSSLHAATLVFALGVAVGLLGIFWRSRQRWLPALTKLQAPELGKLESSLYRQLPVCGSLVAIPLLVAAFFSSMHLEVRFERYLAAFSPFGLAIGFGCWSDLARRRWVQMLSLALLTVGAIFVAWADLGPAAIHENYSRLLVRALLVLATAMFIYGGLVSRFARHHDSWLRSLRQMAVVTCGLALGCLVAVVIHELKDFVPDVGCGMPLFEAAAVAVAVIGMIVGLIVIAVRPENDPFALSLQGRMGYVYVSQLVIALLVMHLFFTMPFLFRIGIKDYWPYIVMLICFGGVGLAGLLENKNLKVLGEPVFNMAVFLPLVVAVAIWGIDSKADHALVMLVVGLVYLMISYTHSSMLFGLGAILFGNLALWLFYDKFDGFSFLDHPQLWLIPPAVSVLVAAQLSKARLTSSQLALIRYICATTIYLSSTSEIFINGLGIKLWPPMVLAVLSLGGIFAGMLLQVRAYLYLGALFLLMAMVTMVSHAHQRLEHVWPWWAFGITMGIAILVMFGLFEKRKNDLKQVVDRLQQWEL